MILCSHSMDTWKQDEVAELNGNCNQKCGRLTDKASRPDGPSCVQPASTWIWVLYHTFHIQTCQLGHELWSVSSTECCFQKSLNRWHTCTCQESGLDSCATACGSARERPSGILCTLCPWTSSHGLQRHGPWGNTEPQMPYHKDHTWISLEEVDPVAAFHVFPYDCKRKVN